MGSLKHPKTAKQGERIGKIDAPLREKLESTKWGEFEFRSIFDRIDQGRRLKKDDQISGDIPFIMAGTTNAGVVNYISNPVARFPKNSITADIFGNVFYRDYDFGAGDDTGVYWSDKKEYSKKTMLFFAIAMAKSLSGRFDFGKKLRSSQSLNFKMKLPVKNDKIDFKFIEDFIAELEAHRIAELEAYLIATNLKDYTLTDEEKQALREFEESKIGFKEFSLKDIFNNIKQGRRLKKDDQFLGSIPFVMAGVTNNGVVNYISNPVARFPPNSITVDIFGNTFYRGFEFGAGDDTGVYWNTKKYYSKEQMLYFTASMSKSLEGKFSFGEKLRSSQSLDFKVFLPAVDNSVNYSQMQTLISAVQKLVIAEVVKYADSKIAVTKGVSGAK